MDEVVPFEVVQRLRGRRRLFDKLASATRVHPCELPAHAFVGPHNYSNWIIPGRICVGAYPCMEIWRREGDLGYRASLAALSKVGVTLFICLDGSEDLLDSTSMLPKYLKDMPIGWVGEAKVFSTPDGAPFDWSVLVEVLYILAKHVKHEASGGCYIHCFGGHGRAGIVAACVLGLVYKLSAQVALDLVQRAHDQRPDPAWPLTTAQRSPQTDEQCDQVCRLLDAVVAQATAPILSTMLDDRRTSGGAGLEHGAYRKVMQLTAPSNEKCVWKGLRRDPASWTGACLDCVICFPNPLLDGQELQFEAQVLKHVGAHKHIIEFVEFIESWNGGPPALVLEIVEPLGYDLGEVLYQHLHADGKMPLNEIRSYLSQLCSALEHLHEHGVAHRDLKPANVVIQGTHHVKLIDFGTATLPSCTSNLEPPRAEYTAPELEDDPRALTSDIWGLGVVIYMLLTAQTVHTNDFVLMSKSGKLEAHFQKCLPPAAIDIAMGLLHHNPAERWSLQRVKGWAGHVLFRTFSVEISSQVQRWSRADEDIDVPMMFGLILPAEFPKGPTVQDLSDNGISVELIVRNNRREPDEVMALLKPDMQLKGSDWICFGLNHYGTLESSLQKHGALISQALQIDIDTLPNFDGHVLELWAKHKGINGVVPFLPEFDVFSIPDYCANAVLGPCGGANLNALDLRSRFGIHLSGIIHADGTSTWFPGVDEARGGLLRKGDRGLIMRVPPRNVGQHFLPSVKGHSLLNLMNKDRFLSRLKSDSVDIRLWMSIAGQAPQRQCTPCVLASGCLIV